MAIQLLGKDGKPTGFVELAEAFAGQFLVGACLESLAVGLGDVFAAAAPSHANAKGACPPVSRHGWEWSLMAMLSKPSSSASTA